MKCPICGTWSRVLDTRGPKRRRECGNLHIFNTTENYVGHVSGTPQKWKRNEDIRADPRGASELSRVYGVSETRIREIRKTK